jgi:hypothetical protein
VPAGPPEIISCLDQAIPGQGFGAQFGQGVGFLIPFGRENLDEPELIGGGAVGLEGSLEGLDNFRGKRFAFVSRRRLEPNQPDQAPKDAATQKGVGVSRPS